MAPKLSISGSVTGARAPSAGRHDRLERREPLERRRDGSPGTGRRARPTAGRAPRGRTARRAGRAGPAVVAGVAQDELVASTGHRDVEQPALLLELDLALEGDLVEQLVRDRQWVAPAGGREPPGDEAGQEDGRELEALGLVDREHGDRVGVRVEVDRRRIVAGLEQGREMRARGRRAGVGGQLAVVADELEEPGHVAERLLGRERVRAPPSRASSPDSRRKT